VSVANLAFGNKGTINGDATLTVTNLFVWEGGTFNSPGTSSILAGATFELDPVSSGDNDTIDGGYTVKNAGVEVWIGKGNITGDSSGTINNSGTLLIDSDSMITNAFLANSGTIIKQGTVGQTSLNNGVLDNTGVVNVDTGTILATSSTLLAGQFSVASDATLNVFQGVVTGTITAAAGSMVFLNGFESITDAIFPVTIAPGAALNGPGNYSISVEDIFNTNVTIQNLQFSSGTLDGPANVTVTHELDWAGGQFNDRSGTLTIPVGALIDISGNTGKTFNGRTVNLAGQAIWTGTGSITFSGSPLNILPTGIFTIKNDQPINGGGNINNLGTITKVSDPSTGAGLGTTTIGVFLSNTGTVSVTTGTLSATQGVSQLSEGQLSGGNWSVASGSSTPVVLNLGPAITTIGPAASVTLSGRVASFADLSGLSSIAGGFSLFAGQDFVTSSNLTNSGSIVIGGLGLLTVPGNYSQTMTGSIFDYIQRGANGQVVVGGTATLAGTFTATVAPTFQPPIETVFTVLTFAKRAGSFGAINGLTLPGGEILSPAFNPTNFTLTAVPTNVATNVTTQVTLTLGAFQTNPSTGIVTQTIVVKNTGKSAITGPISLVLDSLTNASLINQSGKTLAASPSGSPYINLTL
jgi:fibronectin-binding autotransporter adhesin